MPAVRAVRPAKLRALVAVCAKCDGDPKALRRRLKREFKDRGAKGSVRVVASSCLDLCPKRSVAIAVSDDRGAVAGARYYVVAADADASEVVSRIDAERGAGPRPNG